MRIGYPCINNSIGCTSNKTFRLKSYSAKLLKEKTKDNLNCLFRILRFNKEKNILFFRIGSGLIPFASHSICKTNWQDYFRKDFKEIGDYIKENNFRISMHPDQFVLVNAKNQKIFKNSVRDLVYHTQVLNLMGLNYTHKIQIHVGGVYGDKEESVKRFVKNFKKLPMRVQKRLAIENDDKSYSLQDCLEINEQIGIPIIFDTFHHQILNNGESLKTAFRSVKKTWQKKDGVPMIDYSSQDKNKRVGAHSNSINLNHFKKIIGELNDDNIDVMLEMKDKEKSAIKSLSVVI